MAMARKQAPISPRARAKRLPKITIHAKVSQDVVQRLDAIADKNGISRSAAAAIALSKFVDTGI